MAQITKKDVLKLAQLARLKLKDDEVEAYQSEISEIISYVEMLKDVDTEGLKPTYQVTGLVNVTRSDEVVDYGSDQAELLKNLPDREGDYIKVKRMIA